MKKRTIIFLALAIQGSTMQGGFTFSQLKQGLQAGIDKLKQVAATVKAEIFKPSFKDSVMVFNIADSYVITAGGVTIHPRQVQWVTAAKGGSFTITAKSKSDNSSAGKPITYTRLATEDVLEVDVGRAPAFPKIVDRTTNRELVQKQSWKGGNVSATVKIWTRALSKVQAKNGYDIHY